MAKQRRRRTPHEIRQEALIIEWRRGLKRHRVKMHEALDQLEEETRMLVKSLEHVFTGLPTSGGVQ